MHVLRAGIRADSVVCGIKMDVLRRCSVGLITRLVPVAFRFRVLVIHQNYSFCDDQNIRKIEEFWQNSGRIGILGESSPVCGHGAGRGHQRDTSERARAAAALAP